VHYVPYVHFEKPGFSLQPRLSHQILRPRALFIPWLRKNLFIGLGDQSLSNFPWLARVGYVFMVTLDNTYVPYIYDIYIYMSFIEKGNHKNPQYIQYQKEVVQL
jgi:hypothetical protein